MTAENQVVDAELDEPEAVTKAAEEQDSDRPALAETAPQCAGCHRRGIELTLLENGKRYCERCAQEVERLMGIGPLFPVAAEFIVEASEGHLHSPDDSETDFAPAAALIATEVDEGADGDAPEVVEAAPPSIEATYEPEPIIEHHPAPSEPSPAPVTTFEVADTSVPETAPTPAPVAEVEPTPIAASIEPETTPVPDEGSERFTGLDAVVAGANHDAASSSNPHIPRPTASQQDAVEEPPLMMERVQEQTRPVRLETPPPAPEAAPAAAPPSSDLAGALAAERARLLDQRQSLEARFRTEVEAIDERLLHVESLLSDERVALAS